MNFIIFSDKDGFIVDYLDDDNRLIIDLGKLFPSISFFKVHAKLPPGQHRSDADILVFIGINDIRSLASEMKKNSTYKVLFPPDADNHWGELLKNFNNGDYNVIKFFLKKTDKMFIDGYNKVMRDDFRINNTSPVLDIFKEKHFNYEAASYYFTDLTDRDLLYICEHSPPTFYKAFEYYAHKKYTLLRLGQEFPHKCYFELRNESLKKMADNENLKLLKNEKYRGMKYFYDDKFIQNHKELFEKIIESRKNQNDRQVKADFYEGKNTADKLRKILSMADEILGKLFITKLYVSQSMLQGKYSLLGQKELERFKIMLQAELFLLIQEKLESTPKVNEENNPDEYGRYTPTSFIILTKQIINPIYKLADKCFTLERLRNKKKDTDNIDSDMNVFTKSDLKKIKDFCNKILNYKDFETDLQYKLGIGSIKQFIRSNNFVKVEILNYLMDRPQYSDMYEEKDIEKIRELFSKLPSSSKPPETVQPETDQLETEKDSYTGDRYSEYSPVKEFFEKSQAEKINKNIQKYGKKLVNCLIKHFEKEADKDFITYLRDTALHDLIPEITVYDVKGGPHNKSNLFIKYIMERKLEKCDHTSFAIKIRRALEEFRKKYKGNLVLGQSEITE
jgi:hypothetical protein